MCGLFGMVRYGDNIKYKDINDVVESLAEGSAIRGIDATGISYVKRNKLVIDKSNKPAYKFKINVPLDTKVIMGHTRKTTQGSEDKNFNNHPFKGKSGGNLFSLAHNGILSGEASVRAKHGIKQSKIQTDSYLAVQLLEHYGKFNIDGLKFVGENLRGMFSFTLLDARKNDWYLIKGDSPLKIMHFPEYKMYVYASTTDILIESLLASPLSNEIKHVFRTGVVTSELLEPKEGEIWRISSKTGEITKSKFKYTYDYGYYDSTSFYFERYPYNSGVTPLNDYDVPFDYSTDDTGCWNWLLELAESIGFTENDVKLAADFGCSFEEIEDALYFNYFDALLVDIDEYITSDTTGDDGTDPEDTVKQTETVKVINNTVKSN